MEHEDAEPRRSGFLARRYKREWAYAGFFFDLTGAAYLHGAVGDLAGIVPPLAFLVLLGISLKLRPAQQDAPAEQTQSTLSAA